MRLRNLILIFAALATVAVLAACGSSEQSGGEGGGQAQQENPDKQVAPQQGAQEDSGDDQATVEPPSDDTMKLTVPKMEQIKEDEIPTGLGTDETLFHDYAGVHIKHTGYPWEQEANVYIAGHRLGYEGTNSHLAFWDLNKLEEGDEFYITDSEGRQYNYKVFRKFVTTPDNLSVLATVEGKNIVTLQTCTLPDYTNRLLVRAELEDIKEA
ncbi:MAG: class E sortase [Actinomycetota bacterium]|nr:class E sortase [Actinomycetota bacterium]